MSKDQSNAEPVAWREKALEAAGWALCADAKGAGPGHCDPKDCCCHHEARIAVEAYLSAASHDKDGVCRPDASGLIEAAEWHEQQAEEFRIEAKLAGEPLPTPQVVTHLASAYEFRKRAARAADRNGATHE